MADIVPDNIPDKKPRQENAQGRIEKINIITLFNV